MSRDVYLIGSSITSALGSNKYDAINRIKAIDNDNYAGYLNERFKKLNFYSLRDSFDSQEEKFYSVISKIVNDSIIDSGLSKEELRELHVFIGSTSMSISLNEEQNSYFHDKSSTQQLKKIGFGDIGTYVERIIDSKYCSTIIQSACTSSANAFIYAAEQIKQMKIDRAIVIGIEFFNMSTYKGFESLLLLSKSGKYMPFDKNSDGLVLGEASSAIILDSKKNKVDDFRYLSSHIDFDSYSITSSNPDGSVTVKCMNTTLEKANISLDEIDFIKAHATGSEVSNLSEANAIDRFLKGNKRVGVVVLKPFIGHTLGACGTNEMVLLTECVKNRFVPKTINFKEKSPNISFIPLLEKKEVNEVTILFQYIGFGGSNSSILLSNKDISCI